MQIHHQRQFSISRQPKQKLSSRKNKSMSNETIGNFSRKIDKLQNDEQEIDAAPQIMKKRKSTTSDIRSSYPINLSQIDKKQQKSDIGRFGMQSERPKTSSKPQRQLFEVPKKRNTNYFQEDSYKTIHKQFLKTLHELSRKKSFQAYCEEQQAIFAPQKKGHNLPLKNIEYFRSRLSEMKNSSFSMSEYSRTLNNSGYFYQNGFLKENKNQFQDSFEEIGRKIANQEHENPSTIIYNHFSNKYRNYYTIKTKQLTENSKMHKKLQKQQSTILSNLKEKGLSQQSRLMVLSHFCDTCLQMNGQKPKNQQNQLKSRVRTFQKNKNH